MKSVIGIVNIDKFIKKLRKKSKKKFLKALMNAFDYAHVPHSMRNAIIENISKRLQFNLEQVDIDFYSRKGV